jgi:hypothetical protein
LASRTGRPFGAPPTARFNHMGSTAEGTQGDSRSGAGLA